MACALVIHPDCPDMAGCNSCVNTRRFGERETRWVSEERWNFTLIWPSKKHELLGGCQHVLLVLHGIDTVGSVVLNGRHVLEAANAHRWGVRIDICV